MNRIAIMFVGICVLLATAHRLPAPIQEVPESPTPAPEQSSKPKTKPTAKPKATDNSEKSTKAKASSSPQQRSTPKFAGTWTGTVTASAYAFLAGEVTFSSTYTLQVSPNEKTILMEEKRDGADDYSIRQAQFACRQEGDSLVWSYKQDKFITGMCTLRINSNGPAGLAGERVYHNWVGNDVFKITGTLKRQ
jgi:hypothetical protein